MIIKSLGVMKYICLKDNLWQQARQLEEVGIELRDSGTESKMAVLMPYSQGTSQANHNRDKCPWMPSIESLKASHLNNVYDYG